MALGLAVLWSLDPMSHTLVMSTAYRPGFDGGVWKRLGPLNLKV